MPMTVIKGGGYRVLGGAPDGDSIRFYPDAADAWERSGLRVRPNAAGGAQLRLEGIDALETHYAPTVGDLRNLHQPHDLGRAAAAELLRLLRLTTSGAGRTRSSALPRRPPDGARQAPGDRR